MSRGRAHHELDWCVTQLATFEARTPGDDLISRLVAADRAQPAVGHADIASTVELMPVTGHKTT
ncbi:hypothetical protein [Kitasatospora sp. NPDC001175]|uniref:hypothetical protein n=1 Tax=Kitasatospora sp. NPDC001175 TaxID=3157103 RepID=UPI003CFD3777